MREVRDGCAHVAHIQETHRGILQGGGGPGGGVRALARSAHPEVPEFAAACWEQACHCLVRGIL
eukprot:7559920-Alexandrium_andersonii.AAC.1